MEDGGMATAEEGVTRYISNLEVVSSYNWLDDEHPTILVPGMPAAWCPPDEEPELVPDSGWTIIDNNACRSPSSLMQLLVHAVLREHPDYDFTSLDIITDRQALSCLLNLAGGVSKAFTFNAQIVGHAVILTRDVAKTKEFVSHGPSQNMFRGYRDNYEKTVLKFREDVQNSTCHYRIITYTLSGLRLMVRYSADGYLPAQAPGLAGVVREDGSAPLARPYANSDTSTEEQDRIDIRTAGAPVPQATLFELTTRKALGNYDTYMKDKVPDLWLAQTTHYIIAIPTITRSSGWVSEQRGKVYTANTQIRDAAADTKSWEATHRDTIRAFANELKQLVEKLRVLAQDSKSGTFVIEHSEGAKDLSFRESDDVAGLSHGLRERVKTAMKREVHGE